MTSLDLLPYSVYIVETREAVPTWDLTKTIKLNACFASSFNSPSLCLPRSVTNRQWLLLNYYLSLIADYYYLMIRILPAAVGQRNHFAFRVPEWVCLQTFCLAHLLRKSWKPHFTNVLSESLQFLFYKHVNYSGKGGELFSDMSKNNLKFGWI